jgi:hypothetical protein
VPASARKTASASLSNSLVADIVKIDIKGLKEAYDRE